MHLDRARPGQEVFGRGNGNNPINAKAPSGKWGDWGWIVGARISQDVRRAGGSSASSPSGEPRGGRSQGTAVVSPGCQGAQLQEALMSILKKQIEEGEKSRYDVCEVLSPPRICAAAREQGLMGRMVPRHPHLRPRSGSECRPRKLQRSEGGEEDD